jgi:hypothetical protein
MNDHARAPVLYLYPALLTLLLTLAACSDDGDSSPPERGNAAAATVTPASGGNGIPLVFGHAAFDLAEVGYEQLEFFFEGTADAYTPIDALTGDGIWTVSPFSPAFYKTRLVVNRPIERDKFNGSVVVEWFNVSGGADASPDWQHMHVELIREGYAWVGVSAQAIGVGQLACPTDGQGCRVGGDPERYRSLIHPPLFRLWEVAGTAHFDQYGLVQAQYDTGGRETVAE